VSLGLYAEIVRSPEYREAKIETTLGMLPRLLGPGSRPFDLRFTGPAGERHVGAHVVQVSNNSYGRTLRTVVSRPRLDAGRLGVIAVELPQGPPDPAFLTALAAGQPERFPGYVAWEPATFEVDSGDPIDAGIDGEAVRMPPPLRFTIRPGALRFRLPQQASGLSPAARELQRRARVREVPAPRTPPIQTGAVPYGRRRGSGRPDG
jgi:diacylglycerol kinase family enzyme